MAPKQTLSSNFLEQAQNRAFNQLVPKSKTLTDLLGFYGQGLMGEGPGAKTFIPPVKNMEQMYGKPDTIGGEALNFLMDIPLAALEGGRLFTGGISALTNPAGNIIGDFLNQPSEKKRREMAEKKALDASGFELGLPIDKSVPRGQLAPNPIIGLTKEEREAAAKKAILDKAAKSKSNADEFAGIVSDSTEPKATDKTQNLPGEFEAEQDAIKRAERETDIASAPDEDIDYTDTYTEEELKAVNDPEVKKKAAQQQLFADAMKDIEDMYGDGTETGKTKTIDDYKADFAKATGIDISGEPDNRAALMALGLSLMQNRAGKGFNLSNILGEVGRAGQQALPKFEAARKEARAGQIAAGKYALQEQKADQKAALALAKEKRAALAEVSKEFRDYSNKQQLEYLKHRNNMEIKLLENDIKPIDAKGKVTTQTLEGNNFLKVDTAFVTGSRNRVFLAPVQQAEKHANQYVNVLEARNSIDKVKSILVDVGKANDSTAIGLLKDRVLSVLKPLGIGDTDYSKGVADIIDAGTTPEQKISAIQDRLISQYKKFLTKETGNGVSEGDIKRLKQLIGEIKVGQPLAENLNRLDQLSQIFAAPQRAIESQFNAFSKRENYRNDDEYNKTMAILNKAIRTGTENTYNLNVSEDGVINIDLTKK